MNAETTNKQMRSRTLDSRAPFEDTYDPIKMDSDSEINTVEAIRKLSERNNQFGKQSFTLICTDAQGEQIFSTIIGQKTCDVIYSALFK